MSDLPPRPANAVFRIRVDGRVHREIGFSSVQEAEWAAQQQVAPGRQVEIFDEVTGQTVKRL
jgi:hypothetical protein